MGLLAKVSTATGSESYIRFIHELAAIAIVQDGLHEFDTAEAENSSKQSAVEMVSGILLSEESLKDHFSCAAYLMGIWKPPATQTAVIRELEIASYNQIAQSAAVRIDVAKQQFLAGSQHTTNATLLRDAQRTAAADKQTNGAQLTLIDSVGESLALSVDLSDSEAKTTPFLNLTCSERDTLLTVSKAESEADKSDYQMIAGMVYKHLSTHQCR